MIKQTEDEIILSARFAVLQTILCGDRPGDALYERHCKGLLTPLLPEIGALAGVAQPPDFHPEGDVLIHTVKMLNLSRPCARLRWAVLLHDIGKAATQTVDPDGRIRFNNHAKIGAEKAHEILKSTVAEKMLSQEHADLVERMIARHMRWHNIREMRSDNLRKWMKNPGFQCELELHYLDCMGSNGDLSDYDFACDAYMKFFGAVPDVRNSRCQCDHMVPEKDMLEYTVDVP